MKKIGIYSGSFDPIHNGHIAFASEAVVQAGLDKVFLLPEPRPRRKQGVKAFEHRVEMVKLATKSEKKFGTIILEQSRFTPRDTMPVLQSRFAKEKLYMLIGDDMLDHLIDWPNIDELVNSISFVIGIRKYDKKHVGAVANTLMRVKGVKLDYEIFIPSLNSISSSVIKKSIKKALDYSGLDPKVADYIKRHKIYSTGEK